MKNHYQLCRRTLIVVSALLATTCFILSLVYLYDISIQTVGITKFVAFLIEKIPILSVDDTVFVISLVFMVLFGVPQLVISVMVFLRLRRGIKMAIITSSIFIVCGLLMFFITKLYSFVAFFLSLSLLQFFLAVLSDIEYYKYHFEFDSKKYKQIGLSSESAVIYYNSNQFIKKYAYDVANELKGEIFSLELKEEKDLKTIINDSIISRIEDLKDLDLKEDELRTIHIVCEVVKGNIISPIRSFILSNTFRNVRIYYDVVTSKDYSEREIKYMFKNMRHQYKLIYTKMYYGTIIEREQII